MKSKNKKSSQVDLAENKINLDRRSVLKGAAAASVAVGFGISAPAIAQSHRKTFVLVHGAWHGGWCWKHVRNILESRGHRVFTPSLTGLAESSHVLTADVDMNTHIRDIENLFWWEDLEDVTLVAHSYGGWVCSGALEKVEQQVSSLIMVDAFVPEDGTSTYDSNSPGDERRQAGLDKLRAAGVIGRPAPSADAFGVKSPENIAWVNEKMTPQPLAVAYTTIRLTGARERIAKKSYIRALGFPNVALQKAYEDSVVDSAWESHAVPADIAGHDIMVDAPMLLADLIESAAV